MSENSLFKIVSNEGELSVAINDNSGRSSTTQSTAAPRLIPITYSAVTDDPARATLQRIDVVKDFCWTNTNKQGRIEVPKIILKEQYVKFSSLLQQCRYYLSTVPDFIKSVENLADKVSPTVGNTLRNISTMGEKALGVNTSISDLMFNFDPNLLASLNSYLRSYYGIYWTNPTGFQYEFPYFAQEWKEVANTWGDVKSEGGLISGEIFNQFQKLFTGAAADVSLFQSGAYIERTKAFQYDGDGGPSHTFTFHLFNTNSIADIVKNWQLCFLLTYQNLPNRASKVLIEPPVLYEVYIPGMFYSPYAFIDKLSIKQVGATRSMQIPLSYIDQSIGSNPVTLNSSNLESYEDNNERRSVMLDGTTPNTTGNVYVSDDNKGMNTRSTSIETIIPDAYEVTISVKSLLAETKNLYFHNIVNGSKGIYDVKIDAPPPVAKKSATGKTLDESLKYQQDLAKQQRGVQP